MIKELTVKEVAEKLAKEGCFEGYVSFDGDEWDKETITGLQTKNCLIITPNQTAHQSAE